MAEQNAAAANANANAGGEGANATPDNKSGTGDPNQKKGEGQGQAQFSVPRRNAEYWESAQKRREAREARKDFFTAPVKKNEGEGENKEEGEVDDLDKPLTRRELERFRREDRLALEEQIESRTMAQADELAISRFLQENPKFSKFEKEARAVLKDPAYSHADIGLIFRGLAYEDAALEGASRGAKASEKARRDSTSGAERKPQSGQVSGYDPSKHAEFKQKLRQGKAKFSSEE